MVGKVTTGSSFSGLATYLTQSEERVAWTEPRWMIGTDPQEVAREMEAAASLAGARLEKPVYHVSISFGEADHPTREQMCEAADRVLKELGLEDHQALFVAHRDKDHPHVHAMVNRVHPDTGKVADVRFDYQKVERVLRSLEDEWGMTKVPGHHARSQGKPAPDRTQSVSTGEARRARRTGEGSFPEQIRNRMGDDLDNSIRNAKDWKDLQEALGRHGYRIEPTDRGLKITDGDRYAKASSVDERLGRGRLEERFGEPFTGRSQEKTGRGEKDTGQASLFPSSERQGAEGHVPSRSTARTTKEPASLSGAHAPDKPGGHSSVAASLFGKPALEGRRQAANGGGGRLLGAAAAAARPVSGEDGEREAPLRALEVGLRAAAALEGRPAATRAAPDGTGSNDTPVPPVPDPEVRQLARDVGVYERAAQAEKGLSTAAGAYSEAEIRWKSVERKGQEVARLSTTFDRALGEAYRDPAAARRAFEAAAEQHGPAAAARAMRQAPERFGAVVEVVEKKWMGMATKVSWSEGYAAARGAANVGEQYLHSRAAMPGPRQMAALEATLASKGAEMKALRHELGRVGHPSALLEQIGRQARGLTGGQMAQLGRVLSPEQMGVVLKAAGVSLRAARGHGR